MSDSLFVSGDQKVFFLAEDGDFPIDLDRGSGLLKELPGLFNYRMSVFLDEAGAKEWLDTLSDVVPKSSIKITSLSLTEVWGLIPEMEVFAKKQYDTGFEIELRNKSASTIIYNSKLATPN
jgi:hypothetical protein